MLLAVNIGYSFHIMHWVTHSNINEKENNNLISQKKDKKKKTTNTDYIAPTMHRVQRRMISVVNFFVFLRLLFFCFVIAIYDLVHDVESIFHVSYVLTESGNLF